MFFLYLESAVFLTTQADLDNSGTPGATTKDILHNELLPAITAIQTHDPIVVSWGGGGNNLLDFIESPQAAACLQVPSCLSRINALLDEAQQDIDLTIKTLRFFASNRPILMRTQYNALQRTGCATPDRVALADAALQGIGVPGTLLDNNGLNQRIGAVAAKYAATVVDVFPPFAANPNGLVAADCEHPNAARPRRDSGPLHLGHRITLHAGGSEAIHGRRAPLGARQCLRASDRCKGANLRLPSTAARPPPCGGCNGECGGPHGRDRGGAASGDHWAGLVDGKRSSRRAVCRWRVRSQSPRLKCAPIRGSFRARKYRIGLDGRKGNPASVPGSE